MTPIEIHKYYKEILKLLVNGKLLAAFKKSNLLSNELQSPQYSDKLNVMQTSYKYMLQYFMDGVKDSERETLYNKLIAGVFLLASKLRDELLTRDSNNFEFTQKRYFPFTHQLTADDLKKYIHRDERLTEIEEVEGDHTQLKMQIQSEFEKSCTYLFNYFWLKQHFDSPEFNELRDYILSDEYSDSILKSQVISALTLNVWRTFDEDKILILLDAHKSSDIHMRQRALVGICFILAKYNKILPYFPKIRNRLILMTDNSSLVENLQNIIIQIIATTETDEITKKLQKEIFPEIMKLSPMVGKKLEDEDFLKTDEWGEINPEWQDLIDQSGASDKIQEFAELEMEGADVYMSTFSMLKSFPFFNEFSNWFLPFDPYHSGLRNLFSDDDNSLISVFLKSNVMCNSDRYSFCFSIMQMPEMQKNMMKQGFSEAAEQLEEMNKDQQNVSPQVREKNISKHYIQDLFRFFKLNQHRNDFTNMFSMSLILHKTYLFDLLSVDDDIKSNIAEYYFSKKLYPQALELFKELENEGENSASLYQKMGYAYQQNSQIMQALQAYKKADLILPDDFWTNRKIAMCYRLIGDLDNAIAIYKHARFIKPENTSVRLQYIHCLIEKEDYDKALEELKQLNDEYPDNQEVIRLIMITAFANNNIAQADYFSSTLLEAENNKPEDFVIAGNISWCMNKNKIGKERYFKALELLDNDWNKFLAVFDQYENYFLKNGMEKREILLLLDAIKANSPQDPILV